MKYVQVNNSCIYYNEEHLFFIRQYYLYCVELITKELSQRETSLNIIIGKYFKRFRNDSRVFLIDIQVEHTLVLKGGRDSDKAPVGSISSLYAENDFYLVRIQNFHYLKQLDYIIDYSIPNLMNIRSNIAFKDYKTIVISPLLYDFNKDVILKKKTHEIITTFINPSEKRRHIFLDIAKKKGLSIENITGKFSNTEVKKMYSESKILVNIHQTDYHHTLEELRVLPALLCGCIVISENVPLKEYIPYHQYIVWADYHSIVDITKEVYSNYNDYFKKIFIDSDFDKVIHSIKASNYKNIHKMIVELDERKRGRQQWKDYPLFLKEKARKFTRKITL